MSRSKKRLKAGRLTRSRRACSRSVFAHLCLRKIGHIVGEGAQTKPPGQQQQTQVAEQIEYDIHGQLRKRLSRVVHRAHIDYDVKRPASAYHACARSRDAVPRRPISVTNHIVVLRCTPICHWAAMPISKPACRFRPIARLKENDSFRNVGCRCRGSSAWRFFKLPILLGKARLRAAAYADSRIWTRTFCSSIRTCERLLIEPWDHPDACLQRTLAQAELWSKRRAAEKLRTCVRSCGIPGRSRRRGRDQRRSADGSSKTRRTPPTSGIRPETYVYATFRRKRSSRKKAGSAAIIGRSDDEMWFERTH